MDLRFDIVFLLAPLCLSSRVLWSVNDDVVNPDDFVAKQIPSGQQSFYYSRRGTGSVPFPPARWLCFQGTQSVHR
jgi:hypothetical protein